MKPDLKNDRYKEFRALDEPIGNYKELQISVFYSLGGYNYFTYEKNKRGYYLSVTPCNVVRFGDGLETLECSLTGKYSGMKTLLEEVPRFNKKKLETWANGDLDLMIKTLTNAIRGEE